MYGVVRRILSGPRVGAASTDGLALATALLWTVHPLGTEAVVYLVQRTELLMALCLLGTLYAFLASISARPRAGTRHPSPPARWAWAARK